MKKQYKALILICFIITVLGIFVGCNSNDSPYTVNNEKGYTYSVKYDANGGFFTTNTSVIVDSYNLNDLNKNSKGEAEIALLPPDHEARGTDAFTATNNGYFLAGWYKNREEHKDSNGNITYTYSEKWDFNNIHTVPMDKKYSADKPELTLYAAWIPLFEIEYYDLTTGQLMETIKFNPSEDGQSFDMPYWDIETGKIEMNKFPKKNGYTFNGAYLNVNADPESKIKDTTLVHPGTVNYETGTSENSTLKVYVDLLEGDWFNIYTAEQFKSNASVTGNYIIHNDLDFTDVIWPTSFMHGNFSGKIIGNGHVFKNISIKQTDNARANTGLFGQLTDRAVISDVSFENVTLTISGGTRVVANFGLFAGTMSKDSQLDNVSLKQGLILIDSACYFDPNVDYSIGFICGVGDYSKIISENINCEATGTSPEKVVITSNGNEIYIEINLM